MQKIILAAGSVNFHTLPVNSNQSNSMISINGKPVISLILEQMDTSKVDKIIIVMREDDLLLDSFLKRVWMSRLPLIFVYIRESNSIVESLFQGMLYLDRSKPFDFSLGDTLVVDNCQLENDLLYVDVVKDKQRWCIVDVDDNYMVTEFYDKTNKQISSNLALCGSYFISDTNYFYNCCEIASKERSSQLSSVFIKYNLKYPLKAKTPDLWYDFGNIDNLLKAKQQLLQKRFFNSLNIDPLLNTITKVSTFDEKLRDELNWFLDLPNNLKVLTPRIISKEIINNQLHLVQEYYGYPNLSELFVFSDLALFYWNIIINKLLEIHSEFSKFSCEIEQTAIFEMYFNKTLYRINDLVKDPFWNKIFKNDYHYINGLTIPSFNNYLSQIRVACIYLSKKRNASIIHGDFCLSNILFDIPNQIIRLIDPRGSFAFKGIYGDSRYDIAKLRHSFCGYYDFIVSDLFKVSYNNNEFELEFFLNDITNQISDLFDTEIVKFGYSINEIIFIESLLFISMLPLHIDKPERQKAMFVQGMLLLNKVDFNQLR